MAVYVDPLFDTRALARTGFWPFKYACHMTADTHQELEDMARKLSLKPNWIQRANTPTEHYDLTPSKRLQALHYGAIAITATESAHITIAKRREDLTK